jgi:hypothetical protein
MSHAMSEIKATAKAHMRRDVGHGGEIRDATYVVGNGGRNLG